MGGNLTINDQSSTRIILDKNNLQILKKTIDVWMYDFNDLYLKKFDEVLWSRSKMKTMMFSGSTKHLFMYSGFLLHQNEVGDIDLMIPEDAKVEGILHEGLQVGRLKLIGFKRSNKQIITLWNHVAFKWNLQIDLEQVSFVNDVPSEWARFSHSSPLDDFKTGIKGVFHKLALRALTAHSVSSFKIKNKNGDIEEVRTNGLAFSVSNGLRYKFVNEDGVDVELRPKDSKYITSPKEIFETFFPNRVDSEKIWSFRGIVDLVKHTKSSSEQSEFVEAFAYSLWVIGQKLYKDSPVSDMNVKLKAFNYLISNLKCSYNKDEVKLWIETFYSKY